MALRLRLEVLAEEVPGEPVTKYSLSGLSLRASTFRVRLLDRLMAVINLADIRKIRIWVSECVTPISIVVSP